MDDFRFVLAGVLVVGLIGASGWVLRHRPSLTLRQTLLIAAGIRVAVAALAYGYGFTPNDVYIYFHEAGRTVLHGHDPLTTMRQYQWNFLPFFPYVFAAETKVGLPWAAASKLVPILSDLVNVYLIGRFVGTGAPPRTGAPARTEAPAQTGAPARHEASGREGSSGREGPTARDGASGRGAAAGWEAHAGTARLLYALSPVAVLVSAWHGQVEPTSITLGLVALLLARSGRAGTAAASGVALGLAISSKTWPALFAPGVLLALPRRTWARFVADAAQAAAAAVAVVVFWAAIAVFALGDQFSKARHLITGYRSLTGTWGWSGLLRYAHRVNIGYGGSHGHIDAVQHAGTVATVVLMLATFALYMYRRRSSADLTAALLLGFIVTTAGFGPQYLLWPIPLLCAVCVTRRGAALVMALSYMGLAAFYEGLYYLHATPIKHVTSGWPGVTLEILSLAIELAAFLTILGGANETGHTGSVPQRGSDPSAGLREDAEGDPRHRRDRIPDHR